MKTVKNSSQSRCRWLKKPFLSRRYSKWLIDTGSLTGHLQRRYTIFSVQATAINYAKPTQEEAAILRLPSYNTALIREVMLLGDNKPVVFAHSVLPRASLRGAWNGLSRLGNKPLGATLFSNPKVKRSQLRYKKLSSNHTLYKHATQHLTYKPSYLWGRRSIFSFNGAHIMVTEVFLPQLLEA